MTVLSLSQLWINRLDTGEAISAMTLDDRPQDFSDAVDVRTYASGRQRAVSTAGERGQLSYTLALVSLATVTKLRTWKGIAVQVRDHRSQKWFGVFGSVKPIELKDPSLYHAVITLQTVSYTEGV